MRTLIHPSAWPDRAREWTVLSALVLGSAVVIFHGYGQLLGVALLGFCFLMLGVVNAQLAIMVMLTYAFFDGDIRRLVNAVYGWPAIDPLLLLVPVVATIFGLSVLLRDKVDTPISRMVLVLIGLMGLEIFNPLQGGLRVGLGGAFFYIPPLMFFWLGRRYATPAFIESLLYRLVLPISVLAAIAGYMQTIFGFAPWEQDWINHVAASYAALNVGGYIRPFAFFTSSAGYVTVLSIGSVIALAGIWLGHRRSALALVLLLPALVLSSERGPIVKLLVAGLVVWALQRGGGKGWYLRVSLAGLATVGLLAFALPHLMPSHSDSGQVNALLAHQVGGFANPLNAKDSTLMLHLEMLGNGMLAGFTHPYGYGLGATTAAAGKFAGGGVEGRSTETDFGNMFVSLGFVGGIIYLLIMVRVLWALISDWQRRRQRTSLMILAILLVTGAAWLIAGEYSTPLLLWLLIGATDSMTRKQENT
ncbi:membrane protein, putative [Acidithiobacillus ferrooxidans ATCC 23270]|uniref:Membrane protein, putative n=1 Tax=Acidithiobacillus ferrooxidans (strain ATCC 23270 / DSM 14882 / CIP 104768 / NCIMB 8455) TaxID=243159 RepID=B7J9F5_ACIF2|nr:hypothetical protein [Acidithiobacillus ferrooxidans]ACK78675.1 membrane protein, putative [Acidithiobacillus ferrooxidans ATCC 23270]